jgi:hypothetical protein
MVGQIHAGATVLHDDAEAQEFKQFLLEVAEQVAAGRGIGGTGWQVTAEETAFLTELRQILGVTTLATRASLLAASRETLG